MLAMEVLRYPASAHYTGISSRFGMRPGAERNEEAIPRLLVEMRQTCTRNPSSRPGETIGP